MSGARRSTLSKSRILKRAYVRVSEDRVVIQQDRRVRQLVFLLFLIDFVVMGGLVIRDSEQPWPVILVTAGLIGVVISLVNAPWNLRVVIDRRPDAAVCKVQRRFFFVPFFWRRYPTAGRVVMSRMEEVAMGEKAEERSNAIGVLSVLSVFAGPIGHIVGGIVHGMTIKRTKVYESYPALVLCDLATGESRAIIGFKKLELRDRIMEELAARALELVDPSRRRIAPRSTVAARALPTPQSPRTDSTKQPGIVHRNERDRVTSRKPAVQRPGTRRY